MDVDTEKNINGFEALEKLEKQHGKLSKTPCQKTARGGRHYFFQYPKGQKLKSSAGKLGKGLDTRGEGGYVIIAPSPADWFDAMFSQVAEAGIVFTAIGVITDDPASVESVLTWAAKLQRRVSYLVVKNSPTNQAEFTYSNSTFCSLRCLM